MLSEISSGVFPDTSIRVTNSRQGYMFSAFLSHPILNSWGRIISSLPHVEKPLCMQYKKPESSMLEAVTLDFKESPQVIISKSSIITFLISFGDSAFIMRLLFILIKIIPPGLISIYDYY